MHLIVARFPGRLLPQSRLVVANKSPSCWSELLRIPLVGRYISGDETGGSFPTRRTCIERRRFGYGLGLDQQGKHGCLFDDDTY